MANGNERLKINRKIGIDIASILLEDGNEQESFYILFDMACYGYFDEIHMPIEDLP